MRPFHFRAQRAAARDAPSVPFGRFARGGRRLQAEGAEAGGEDGGDARHPLGRGRSGISGDRANGGESVERRRAIERRRGLGSARSLGRDRHGRDRRPDRSRRRGRKAGSAPARKTSTGRTPFDLAPFGRPPFDRAAPWPSPVAGETAVAAKTGHRDKLPRKRRARVGRRPASPTRGDRETGPPRSTALRTGSNLHDEYNFQPTLRKGTKVASVPTSRQRRSSARRRRAGTGRAVRAEGRDASWPAPSRPGRRLPPRLSHPVEAPVSIQEPHPVKQLEARSKFLFGGSRLT